MSNGVYTPATKAEIECPTCGHIMARPAIEMRGGGYVGLCHECRTQLMELTATEVRRFGFITGSDVKAANLKTLRENTNDGAQHTRRCPNCGAETAGETSS